MLESALLLTNKSCRRDIMTDTKSLFDEEVLNDNVDWLLDIRDIFLLEVPLVISIRDVDLELAGDISFTLGGGIILQTLSLHTVFC